MEVATSSVLQLPYTASSVGVARRHLIGVLTEAGVYESTACDAGLVLSELISNALRHATPLPGRTVRIAWNLHQDSVAVAVSDGGGPTTPMVNQPTNWSIGGRGLGIVARLSLRWGVCAGDAHWESDQRGDDNRDRAANGHPRNGRAGNGNRACPSDGGPGETTVWAELPLRYGSPTGPNGLVTASRDGR